VREEEPMRDGIYIRPTMVRLMFLGSLALGGFLFKKQLPDLKRYIKFETM
jgi:hypothetical protein